MSAGRTHLQLEQRTFIDLVEDILQTTPGLRYRLDFADPGASEHDAAYAVFTIETNPAHELAVSIELAPSDFRVHINDDVFSLPAENHRRIDRWIDRRCRDVDQLVRGDLKIEVESLFGMHLSSGLYAGADNRWREIADRDDGWGWIGLLAWLLPFGLSPFITCETEYRAWFWVE